VRHRVRHPPPVLADTPDRDRGEAKPLHKSEAYTKSAELCVFCCTCGVRGAARQKNAWAGSARGGRGIVEDRGWNQLTEMCQLSRSTGVPMRFEAAPCGEGGGGKSRRGRQSPPTPQGAGSFAGPEPSASRHIAGFATASRLDRPRANTPRFRGSCLPGGDRISGDHEDIAAGEAQVAVRNVTAYYVLAIPGASDEGLEASGDVVSKNDCLLIQPQRSHKPLILLAREVPISQGFFDTRQRRGRADRGTAASRGGHSGWPDAGRDGGEVRSMPSI
jgi:hypothetical protein